MVIRVLMGMNFTPEGIEFAPTVPTGMPGVKILKGLNYRRAVLDVTVLGTGNDVESITDNGKSLESAFLPNDIEGNHDIVITLKENRHSSQRVTIHHNEILLPPTPTVTWDNDTGHIEGFVPGLNYVLSVNGEQQALKDSVFVLPQIDSFAEFSVEVAGNYINGFMSRPLFHFGLTPQIAFFPETTDGHASLKVSVAWGGDYLLDVGYNPTGTLDVRRVSANNHPMGTLVMANVSNLDSNGLAYSNMVHVKLLKGDNIIQVDQIRLPKSFTPCEPVHLRIISK